VLRREQGRKSRGISVAGFVEGREVSHPVSEDLDRSGLGAAVRMVPSRAGRGGQENPGSEQRQSRHVAVTARLDATLMRTRLGELANRVVVSPRPLSAHS
jgi:hypothetical protein